MKTVSSAYSAKLLSRTSSKVEGNLRTYRFDEDIMLETLKIHSISISRRGRSAKDKAQVGLLLFRNFLSAGCLLV